MNKKNKKKNINKKIAIFVLLVFLFMPTFRSWAMQSSNYRIDEDSINFGGTDDSSSANYRLSDTMGEIGTGEMSTGCSSLSFDGSDDYVNAGNGSSFNTGNVMSISAWVKFTNLDYSGNTGGVMGDSI